MKRVTKRIIDELANLKADFDVKNKEATAAKKKYGIALEPVLEYINDVLKVPAKKGAQLRGANSEVEFGARAEKRELKDPVEALRRLESVRKGLGYEHIAIALKVLDEQLRAEEVSDLITTHYGARRVKATIFEEG